MADKIDKVDLFRFTFQSLFFCATPVETIRGERFTTAVNKWYMPFIRTGWAVPLCFIVDVATLLLRPTVGFKNRWKGDAPPEVKQLALDYYKMLQKLRRQPIFAEVVELLEQTRDDQRRNEATYAFIRFLLAELSHFRNTYAFEQRKLELISAIPSLDGVRDIKMVLDGHKKIKTDVIFTGRQRVQYLNATGTIMDIMKDITEHYSRHPLKSFISDEERLMVRIAAQNRSGMRRVDYHFLHDLLTKPKLSDISEEEPQPQLVEKIVPTESYEVDGNVGGYIDINRRCFSGSLAETLPAELSLFNQRQIMFQKLLNEGALHFVRENIECIEEELRLLICIVIDVHEHMTRVPADLHPSLAQGLTPYIRARTLASLLTMDLARLIPREKVKVDLALYLWSGATGRRSESLNTYRTEMDLFETWNQETASDRFTFAAKLSAIAPCLFDYRLDRDAAKENVSLDHDPGEYIKNRHDVRHYHCRHLMILTSEQSAKSMIPATDPLLSTSPTSPDSLLLVYCDTNHQLLRIGTPDGLGAALDAMHAAGQLGDNRLRNNVVETIIAKAAGKTIHVDDDAILGALS